MNSNSKVYLCPTTGNLWEDCLSFVSGFWRYIKCNRCQKKVKLNKNGEEVKDREIYSCGESDTDFLVPFNDLDTPEKQSRIKFLWMKLQKRLFGAV